MKWGRLLNKWHDEIGVFHLLKGDGSPACGVSYYTSTGPYPDQNIQVHNKCRRCMGIQKANKRKAKEAK